MAKTTRHVFASIPLPLFVASNGTKSIDADTPEFFEHIRESTLAA